MENKTRLWTKDYVFLLLGSVLLYIGFMVFMPTLPARIIELGGTQMEASLAVGLFSIVALLMRAIAGSWNDKFGPKVLIIVGFLILILTTVNFYWSTAVAPYLYYGFFTGLAGVSEQLPLQQAFLNLCRQAEREKVLVFMGLRLHLECHLRRLSLF